MTWFTTLSLDIQQIAGKKAKGWISKWVLQEGKASQISPKTNISYPLIRTRTCAYQGGEKCLFFGKIWRPLFSYNTCFEIRPYALWPTKCCQWLSRKLVVLMSVFFRVSLVGSVFSRLVGFTTAILLTATPILVDLFSEKLPWLLHIFLKYIDSCHTGYLGGTVNNCSQYWSKSSEIHLFILINVAELELAI